MKQEGRVDGFGIPNLVKVPALKKKVLSLSYFFLLFLLRIRHLELLVSAATPKPYCRLAHQKGEGKAHCGSKQKPNRLKQKYKQQQNHWAQLQHPL